MKNPLTLTIPHVAEITLWKPYYPEVLDKVVEFRPPWQKGRGRGLFFLAVQLPDNWQLTIRGGKRKPLSEREFGDLLREYYDNHCSAGPESFYKVYRDGDGIPIRLEPISAPDYLEAPEP